MVQSNAQNGHSQAAPGEKKDIGLLGGLGVLAAVAVIYGAIAGWFDAPNLARFEYRNFEPIHLSAYILIGALAGVATWLIRKYTDALSRRVGLIKPIWTKDAGILAGRTTSGGVDLFVPDKTRTGHVQIIAATGRGKTQSVIEPWTVRDIRDGKSVILIDGKGDPGLVAKIQRAIEYLPNKPELKVFDLGNAKASCTTNPLQYGSPQQIVDRIFTAFLFKDEYYEAVQYDIAGAAVELIQEVDGADDMPGVVTFRRLYEMLTNDRAMQMAIGRSKNEPVKALLLREYLTVNPKDRPQLIKGLISQMGPFSTREVAGLVNGPTADASDNTCSISELLLSESGKQRVYIFLIPTLKYQKLGAQLGKLLLQELGWAVGERESRYGESAPFTPVFLDEFSSFAYEGFENILNKARSSQTALHLSHQSIGDFSKISPDLAEIINTNTNTKCLLGLNDPKTAEFFAKHIGTQTTNKLTERASATSWFGIKHKTGDVSMRDVEEFIVHPNRLKNYMNGVGVLHMPGPKGNITEEIQYAALSRRDLKQRKGGIIEWLKGLF